MRGFRLLTGAAALGLCLAVGCAPDEPDKPESAELPTVKSGSVMVTGNDVNLPKATNPDDGTIYTPPITAEIERMGVLDQVTTESGPKRAPDGEKLTQPLFDYAKTKANGRMARKTSASGG